VTSSKDGSRQRLTSAEFISLFKEVSTRPEIYFLLMRFVLQSMKSVDEQSCASVDSFFCVGNI